VQCLCAVAADVTGVAAGESGRADELRLLELARDGDRSAFGELAGRYQAGLRAHCYRIIGSLPDAEDVLQEALLRAWRGLAGFEGRGSVPSWLYAIVTNAALDYTRRRSRRELPVSFGPAARTEADLDPPLTDQPWLGPFPDHWLTGDERLSPEARYEQRESIELAFLVALQHLPPLQRAVLLLREVVGLPTAEIATQLNTTPTAVNSALQRARATVRDRLPATSQQSALRALGDQRTKAIVQRYADAIERGDADTLISMLTRDATWSMPPVPTYYRGHPAIRRFLERYPLAHRWQRRATQANGQLAVAGYLFDDSRGSYEPFVIDVLTIRGTKIAAVTAFLAVQAQPLVPSGTRDPDSRPDSTPESSDSRAWITGAQLFSYFGLPAELP
jgi:RNA polymerase sigma-70 factor, ECF subfamily